MIFNKQKFKQMILYFSHKCVGDPHFGVIKLNKLLFLSDFYTYAKTMNSISGATYVHLENGPAPKEIKRARQEMNGIELIVEKKRVAGGFQLERTVAKQSVDMDVFSPEEVIQM